MDSYDLGVVRYTYDKFLAAKTETDNVFEYAGDESFYKRKGCLIRYFLEQFECPSARYTSKIAELSGDYDGYYDSFLKFLLREFKAECENAFNAAEGTKMIYDVNNAQFLIEEINYINNNYCNDGYSAYYSKVKDFKTRLAQYFDNPSKKYLDSLSSAITAYDLVKFIKEDFCMELKVHNVNYNRALGEQVGGDHYKKLKIQPMEYSMANNLDSCQHTIIKYVTRFRDKGGVSDLEKARHCIDMLIEFERKSNE